ncbi:MAG: beta-carotene 15,15'-monooxygenase, partial [Lactobacillus iners]|nr:beta-carotene 15,15'-monooxygenase [Lactobacillus iners]
MHENSENKKEKQQNDTVLLMVEWIKHNAVLVFVLGIVLMIITSIIAFMGWAVLVCLLMLLYFTCANEKIAEEYTVDRKLEEKVDVVGSSLVN